MLKIIVFRGILLTFALIAGSSSVLAVDIEASVAPAVWSYKQNMNAVAGAANKAPMSSSTRGSGILMRLLVKQKFFERFTIAIGGESLSSISARDEVTITPAGRLNNKFNVTHNELQANIFYRLDELTPILFQDHEYAPVFSVGGWVSWQDDTIRRERFILNNTLTPPGVAEPVRETTQATWLGLSILGDIKKNWLQFKLDIGVPLAVKNINDAIPGGTFTNNQTVRWNIGTSYRAYEFENGMTTKINLDYRYRELGNEIRKNHLWPTNKWRVLSLGISQTW